MYKISTIIIMRREKMSNTSYLRLWQKGDFVFGEVV